MLLLLLLQATSLPKATAVPVYVWLLNERKARAEIATPLPVMVSPNPVQLTRSPNCCSVTLSVGDVALSNMPVNRCVEGLQEYTAHAAICARLCLTAFHPGGVHVCLAARAQVHRHPAVHNTGRTATARGVPYHGVSVVAAGDAQRCGGDFWCCISSIEGFWLIALSVNGLRCRIGWLLGWFAPYIVKGYSLAF